MERRLGRGLGSLLGDSTTVDEKKTAQDLLVVEIRSNPRQPRRFFEDAALRELADSLSRHGFLQPVVVRASGSGFELISGERRWRAAQLAGLERIPAIVRENVSEEQMLELALVENLQREELDAIERAQGFRSLIETFGITQDEVARKVGLKRATVANHLRLLDLPAEVQAAVSRALISMGHARALLSLESPRRQLEVLGRIVREGLSVRQVEAMARSTPPVDHDSGSSRRVILPHQPWISDLEGRMRDRLGTKVAIENGLKYRGRVVIDYYDRASLERICQVIAPPAPLD